MLKNFANLDEYSEIMITASEPLEFIPRGRQAVNGHPGPLVLKKPVSVPSDFILLQRMQDVNISLDDSPVEFYQICETYNELEDASDSPGFLREAEFNTEEELYVKGNTAVWTTGLSSEEAAPHTCLTCENPIKFAFFSPRSFVAPEGKEKQKKGKQRSSKKDQQSKSAVCLMDGSSLKVYCSSGENFVTSIECPISNVWISSHGILLEKEPSNALIDTHSIPMPRLFSLTHPLDEMCPVLIKMNNTTSYLTEAEYRVVFSCEENKLVLMFDEKLGKHFVCFLRKATDEEKNDIGCGSDSVSLSNTVFNLTGHMSHQGMTTQPTAATPQSFYKNSLLARHSASKLGQMSFGATQGSPYVSNLQLGQVGSFNLNATGVSGATNRSHLHPHATTATTPLSRLQSTLGGSVSLMDVRKMGQAEPSKPIVPEYCLEHVWTDNIGQWKEFPEIASKGFIHVDLVGDAYLCFLLARSAKLSLLRIDNSATDRIQISPSSVSNKIPATCTLPT